MVEHSESQSTPAALEGVRVLDLSRFIAGPLCCQMLGDMGAEVIKVERPSGEDSRQYSPRVADQSIYSLIYNRNKHGITLDTRHPRARPILEKLIVESDVIVENYRPGTMEKMGFGWERIREINDRAILTSISGFGQTGPNVHRALFDAIAQANSGLMSLTGGPDDPPLMTGTFIADYTSAFHGVMGTLFALLARERTGKGQHVDIACVDAVFSSLCTHPSAYAMLGVAPRRTGNRDQITVPANLYPAQDGYVYLHGGTNPLFKRLAEAMGQPELASDGRFAYVKDRLERTDEVDGIVRDWTSSRTCAEIVEALTVAGVPVSKVASVDEVVDSEQVRAREMMLDVEHPELGLLKLPGIAIKLGATPGTVRKAPPLPGEDDVAVYRNLLGFTDEEFEQLRAEGVIAPEAPSAPPNTTPQSSASALASERA
jgi:crotonobetainyl-CoA:carnitine CoA-transferase CaiB-like acyl-CoA transferase